jgi:hypothetical protein
MTALVWDEAPIAKRHDRAAFDCGDPDLNLYLQKFARQNHESGGAKCFIAAPSDGPTRILGFYTLSPASIEYSRAPALAKKGLARYDVPMFRLGRLAVDKTAQGRALHSCRAACWRRRLADRRQDRSRRTLVRKLWRSPHGRRPSFARAAACHRRRCA